MPVTGNEPVAGGRKVAVVPWDPSWVARFEQERGRIAGMLGAVALRIDHVGSTAVPGLDAKPIVDVQVSVRDLADEAGFRPGLEMLGYEFGRFDDIPDRAYFKLNEDGIRVVQLSVCEAGSAFERDHLTFRDLLRADPELRARYAELKRDLAERFPDDRYGYTAAKTPFIAKALGLPGL